MPFANTMNPGCNCCAPPPCLVTISTPAPCAAGGYATKAKIYITIKNAGGTIVATGSNWSDSGGVTYFNAVGPFSLPAGNYTLTATFSQALNASPTNVAYQTPTTQSFTLTCPAGIGLVVPTTITGFNESFYFAADSIDMTGCSPGAGCTTIYGILTVTSDSAGFGNVGQAGDYSTGGPALISLFGGTGGTTTLGFSLPVVYTHFQNSTCAQQGVACKTYCGTLAVSIDPCANPDPGSRATLHIPMSICAGPIGA